MTPEEYAILLKEAERVVRRNIKRKGFNKTIRDVISFFAIYNLIAPEEFAKKFILDVMQRMVEEQIKESEVCAV